MTALLYVRRKLSRGAACYMLHARRIWPGPFEHVRLLCARSLSARVLQVMVVLRPQEVCPERSLVYATTAEFRPGLMYMYGGITPAGYLPGALQVMTALRSQDVCPGCSMVCFTPAESLPGALQVRAALRPQDVCPGAALHTLRPQELCLGPYVYVWLLYNAHWIFARGVTGHGCFTPAGCLPGVQQCKYHYASRNFARMAALRPQDLCLGRCR